MRTGKIEGIFGPMFSGKSEELQRRIRRAIIGKQDVLIFKPKKDDRYSEDHIVTHRGEKIEAISIASSEDIFKYYAQHPKLSLVAIDEIQFFDSNILEVVKQLANNGVNVIASGLDMDFKCEPFFVSAYFMAIADDVLKLTAVCEVCGSPATLSQRFLGDKPASFDDEIEVLGHKELYAPRCKRCYNVERTLNKKLSRQE